VLLHDRFDCGGVVLAEKQVLDADETDEFAALRHIAGVDRLLVDAGAADAEDGLLDRHGRAQGDVFGGHDAAGGILGIAQDLVDLLAHVRVRLRKNSLNHVGRHFLDDVDGIVDVQLVDNLLELGVGEAADQQLLCFGLHLDEGVSRELLGQKPEQERQTGFLELVENRGDIGRVHGVENVPQRIVLLFVEKLDERILYGEIVFRHGSFLLKNF